MGKGDRSDIRKVRHRKADAEISSTMQRMLPKHTKAHHSKYYCNKMIANLLFT